MADKITEGTILAVGLEYESLENKIKTTYVKVPNPKNDLTEALIKQIFNEKIIGGPSPILRDAEGDAFDTDTAVLTAYTEYEKKIEYDLGLD